MKKTKKMIVLISIVLISLLAMGAVSAADDMAVDDDSSIAAVDEVQAIDETQTNDEIIQEPDVVEETQATEGDSPIKEDDPPGDETTKTFSQLIDDIGTEGNEVTLEGTYKYDPTVDNTFPIIRRDLTINGPATIDGNGASKLFAITGGGTLTLKNLNLINGYGTGSFKQGGAVLAQQGNLVVERCTFKDNSATANGGTIFGTTATIVIEGCTFTNSVANLGGAVAVAGNANLNIKDSTFESTESNAQGGAIFYQGTSFEAIDCTFRDCHTKNYGGAIWIQNQNAKISGCNFINNYVDSTGSAGLGGAIGAASENTIITDSIFKANTASAGGSAIYITGASPTISNCLFDSNVVPSGTESGYQGTVYIVGTDSNPDMHPVITKCIFVNNTAFRGSAVASLYSGFTVEDSIFLDNIATDQVNTLGAEARDIFYIEWYGSSATAIVKNNWFGSTADNYTNVITFNETRNSYQGVTNVDMTSWYFLDLAATAGLSYYDLLISLNNLYNPDTGEVTKDANYDLPDLNVVLTATAGELYPANAALENGVANAQYLLTPDQGPATVTADVSGIKVSKVLEGIELNYYGSYTELQRLIDAAEDGATINLDHNIVYDAILDGANFLGGMSVTKSVTIIGAEGVEISGNDLARIFKVTDNAVLTLKDLTLCHGYADENNQNGGAIAALGGSLDIQGCTFKNNNASQHAGAIRVESGSIIIKDSLFEANVATKQGSAIGAAASATAFEIINCTFIDNVAKGLIGAIDTACAHSRIIDSKFTGSSSTRFGGAICLRGASSIVKNTIFENNQAPYGGGIYVYYAPNCQIDNCTFKSNTGTQGGSAIYIADADATISNCIFDSNVAPSGPQYGYPGTIYLDSTQYSSSMQTISKCIFVNNSAVRGAAIFSWYSNFVVVDSIFLDNIATDEAFLMYPEARDICLYDDFNHHTFEHPKTAIVNNNWFGSTANNYTAQLQTLHEDFAQYQGVANVKIDNWYFLNLTETAGSSYYDLLISLNNLYTNDTGEVTQVADCGLPDWEVFLSATKGTVTPTQVTLENGIAHAQYELTAAQGPATITADALGPKVSKELPGISGKQEVEVTTSSETVTVAYPETGSITITASAPGTYTVHVGDNEYTANIAEAGGSATVTVPTLAVGSYDVSVTAPETEEYYAVDTGKIATYTVTQGTVTVTSANVTVTYPDTGSVTITASLAGEYTVKVGDKTYTATITEDGGSANVPVELLDVGDYGISVSGSAGDNYYPIDTGIINYYHVLAGSITVTGQGTTVTYPGKGTIVVNTDVAGAYTIKVGDKTYSATLVAGANEFNVPDVFNAGDYDVKVSASIPNYNAITDQSLGTYTVNKGTITVSTDGATVTFPNTGTITIVTNAAGEYTIKIGDRLFEGIELDEGSNSFVVRDIIGAGNHDIKVSANIANYEALNDVSIGTYTVNKGVLTIEVVPSATEITFGDSITLSNVITAPEGLSVMGTITYYLDGNAIEGNVLSDLAAGTHTVAVKYTGDNFNDAESEPVTITVNKATITVSSSDVTVTYPGTGSVAITASVAGYYYVGVGGNIYEVHIFEDGGSNTASVSLLDVGVYPVTVSADIPNYELIVDKVVSTYTVNNGIIAVSVTNESATYPYTGALTVTASVGGDYTVKVGTYSADIVIGPGGGSYLLVIPTMGAGVYDISVNGTVENYEPVDTGKIGTYTVHQGFIKEFDLVANATTITYGDTVSLTSNVEVYEGGTASGTVTYYLDGVAVEGNVLSGLDVGTYTVVAKYSGDPNIGDAESDPVTITVAPGASSVAVDPISFDYEASCSATATLDGATGVTATIEGYPDAVAVEGNVITVSGLPAGDYIMVVTTIPDANHIATSIEVAVTVNKIASTIAIDPISFAYGGSGSAAATLTGAETVTATIEGYPDAVAVEGNVITVSGLPSGSYTMVVTTVPDANHYAVSTNVPVGVGKEDATITLSADKESIAFGESVTLSHVLSPEGATGDVTYYLDNEPITGNVLSGLDVGTYTVVAKYAGDDNYNAANSNAVTITVTPVDSSVAVDPISFTYGESGSAVATLDGATGVTAVIDGFADAVSVDGATITVSGLPAGTYTMAVTTVPDANHNAVTVNVDVTVNKAAATVSLSADKETISFGESVILSSVVSPDGATGDVTYYLDGVAVEGNVLSGLAAGTYTVVAKYAGDDNYNAAESDPLTITVNKADASVVLSADKESIPFGDTVTLTATVSPDGATGDVTYYLDGEPITGNVLSGLAVGTYTVVAKYAGDDNYNAANSNAVTITVGSVDSSVAVDPISFTYGESGSATATLVGATGVNAAIEGYDGAVSVEGNVITVSGLPAGTYTMVVTTIPDADHNAVTANVDVTVNKADPVLVISANATDIKYPESIKLSSTLTPEDATGSVVYYLDGTPIDSDVLARLAPGVYTVTAKYGGNDNYNEADSSNSLEITVGKCDLSIEVTAESYTISYGEDLFISRILTPADASVAVTYIVDGVEVDYQLISGLSVGTHTIAAKASESVYYTGAISETKTVTVTKAVPIVTITPTKEVYPFGEDVVLDLTVKDGETGVTGTVVVNVAGVNYAVDVTDGTGQLTVKGLASGTYEATAHFIATDNYDAATAVPASVVVDEPIPKPIPVVTIIASKEAYGVGEDPVLHVTVMDDTTGVSGMVIVTINDVKYLVDVTSGTGQLTVKGLINGEYEASADFIATDEYDAASAAEPAKFTVDNTVPLIQVDVIVTAEPDQVIVSLVDENGNPVDGKAIVAIDGVSQEVNVTGGIATIPASAGYHNVSILYEGDDTHAGTAVMKDIVIVLPQKIGTTMTISRSKTLTYNSTLDNRSDYLIYATLKDANGNPLANKQVSLAAHGGIYNMTTDSKGQVKFYVAHSGKGVCTQALSFLGDEKYDASFVATNVQIEAQTVKFAVAKKTYKASAKTKTLTATLKNSKGKALAGKKVVITVNGKKYTATTNSKGVATVKVSITKKGTYKVTATFTGDKTYKKATRTNTLVIT